MCQLNMLLDFEKYTVDEWMCSHDAILICCNIRTELDILRTNSDYRFLKENHFLQLHSGHFAIFKYNQCNIIFII